MKPENKKYLRLGVTVFLSLAAAILFFFFLLRFEDVKAYFNIILSALQPLFVGIIMAYLLCPATNFFEKRFAQVKRISRFARPFSILVVFLLAVGVLGLFCAMVLPQLVDSVANLAKDLPELLETQLKRMNTFLKSDNSRVATVMQIISSVESFIVNWIKTELFPTVSMLAGSILSIGSAVVNLFVAITVAIYLLFDRERYLAQCSKLFYAVSKNKRFNRAVSEFIQQADAVFSGFISGKLLDSLIVGIICYIGMLIMKMPYTVLISVIIGVTNIIPVFGPFIGAIPSIFLLLLISPKDCIAFLIFIIVLQQIDGNIIGTFILGNSTGISAFYVTVAVMFFGDLMGFAGMLIGVPLLAMIYYVIKRLGEYSLKQQQMPVETTAYIKKEKLEPVEESAQKEKKN